MNKRIRRKKRRPEPAPEDGKLVAMELPLDAGENDDTLSLSQQAERLDRQNTRMKEQIAELESLIVSTPFNRALHRIKTFNIVPADLDDDDSFSSPPAAQRLSHSRRHRLRELQFRNVGAFVALAVGLVLLAIWFSRLLAG
ncbi:MAG: hypothetical protein AAF591_04455 [Verrucomicrobiota bacterium]